jgi:hypothetical protein
MVIGVWSDLFNPGGRKVEETAEFADECTVRTVLCKSDFLGPFLQRSARCLVS